MSSDIWRTFAHKNRVLNSPDEWDLEKVDGSVFFDWINKNSNLAGILCVVYVIVVFGGQSYMKKREKFDLRKPLICWSAILAIFSIIGAARCIMAIYKVYDVYGMRGIVCSDHFYLQPIARFWGPAFCLSKVPELIDTVFIVLRKQKLIFLHWYHHITVLLFSWHCYGGQRPGSAVFMVMNLVVHSMMYSYYAFRAGRVKIPRFISIIITTFQILQMFLGVYAFYWINRWRNDEDCRSTNEHLWYGVVIYGSYLVLFCHFFYNAYIKQHTKYFIKPEDKKAEAINITTNGNGKQSPSTQTAIFPEAQQNTLRSRRNIGRATDA